LRRKIKVSLLAYFGVLRKNLLYKTKVEYGDYALNHYEGCQHGCKYCYARMIKKKPYQVWVKARPVANAISLLKKELPVLRNEIKEVYLCFSCDPYMPLERKTQLTQRIIKILMENDVAFSILTKSDLVLRDLNLLSNYDKCRVGFTITTLNDNVRKFWEPYAPSIEDRIRAVKTFHDYGVETWISVEPILDNTYIDLIYKLQDYVNQFVFGKLNYMKSNLNWRKVAEKIVETCKELGLNFILKKELANHLTKCPGDYVKL